MHVHSRRLTRGQPAAVSRGQREPEAGEEGKAQAQNTQSGKELKWEMVVTREPEVAKTQAALAHYFTLG